jgi:cyclic pyranopterin phosphate synthase
MKSANKDQPIKDSYNRQIDYIRISITDKCNLKCVYCMPSESLKLFKKKDVMTDDEILRFIRIAVKHGLRKVRITGGEPLTRRNLTGLISSIKKTGVRDLSITTNGILLSKRVDDLKKAGLDRVNISLDTLDPDRFRTITGGGDIALVWESIKKAQETGLTPVKINIVPIRGINDDEIASFASLTFDNDFHIRFIEFMPATRNGIWEKDKCVTSEEAMKKISALGRLEHLTFRGRGPSRNYRIKGAKGVIGFISPLSDHFCGDCSRLRLTADGEIRPCLFSNIKVDIKTPMRNGASDEEIDELFCKAVRVKPEKHLLNEDLSSANHLKSMHKIGG